MDEHRPVVVVGASAIDTKGRASRRLEPGSSSHGRIQTSFGGVARNIAENLARLGVPTALLSAVGNDPLGREILDRGAASGVDVSRVLVSPDQATGAYLGITDQDGAPVFSLDDMEIMQEITPRYLQTHRRVFQDAAMIVMDANLSPNSMRSLVALARRHGIPICADPTSVELAPKLARHLADLHMVTPNAAEARSLLGIEPDAQREPRKLAKTLVERGVHLAIVTMGQEGLVYADREGGGSIPAIRCDIVDRTGAGDALTAAVVFGLLNELPVDEAVRLGVSAATLTLQCKDTVCQDLSLERLYDQLVI